jgi:phosphatidate cytidylyltransferase
VRRGASPAARRVQSAGRRNQRSDLAGRVLAAIPAIAFAIAIVVAGGWVWVAGLAVLGCICLHELYTMLERTRPAKLAGFVALIALLVAARAGSTETVLLVFVLSLPFVFVLAANAPGADDLTPPIAVTMLGIAWIGLALAHAVLLRGLPHGAGIIIDVLVGTFLADTVAYLGGRLLGRRPLAPRISPHKTVEGLACGVVGALAGVWFAGLYQDWLGGGQALILGAGVALAGPLGDLFESALKRGARTKDTGRLFGPHGGALDRLDAVLFTAVAGYWIWRALLA